MTSHLWRLICDILTCYQTDLFFSHLKNEIRFGKSTESTETTDRWENSSQSQIWLNLTCDWLELFLLGFLFCPQLVGAGSCRCAWEKAVERDSTCTFDLPIPHRIWNPAPDLKSCTRFEIPHQIWLDQCVIGSPWILFWPQVVYASLQLCTWPVQCAWEEAVEGAWTCTFDLKRQHNCVLLMDRLALMWLAMF